MTTASPIELARAYVAKIPGAVQGQGGDNQTFKVAVVVAHDFALSESEAWGLLLEYNARCLPPWPEAVLRGKLRSALNNSHRKPRGNLLRANHETFSRPVLAPEQKREQWPEFHKPSKAELDQITEVRNLSVEGLNLAVNRGVLWTARLFECECWIATDSSRRAAQARRLDGKPFPRLGQLEERKTHTLAGSSCGFPIGLPEVENYPNVLFVEGSGDFLAGFHFIEIEEKAKDTTVCAMFGAKHIIAESALPAFQSKRVRIFPHADKDGRDGAEKWARALLPVVCKLDALDLSDCHKVNGELVKDLNDLCWIHADDFEEHRLLWNLCPA